MEFIPPKPIEQVLTLSDDEANEFCGDVNFVRGIGGNRYAGYVVPVQREGNAVPGGCMIYLPGISASTFKREQGKR